VRGKAVTNIKIESPPEKKEPSLSTWIALGSAVVAIIAALITYEQVNVTNQQNIAADIKTESPPEKNPPKKKEPSLSTWIALGSVVVAIIAAVIASWQVNVAIQQNIATKQQQLVTLTSTIAQQLDQVTPPTSNGQQALSDELTIEGQTAEGLISELNGNGITSVEYEKVAKALTYGTDAAQAIAYFQDAVNTPPHDVGVQSEALRQEGNLYYDLGQPATGHDYIMRSIQIFSAHLLMSQVAKDNEIAQAYLNDADQQLNINRCTTAAAEIMAANKLLSQAGFVNATNAPGLASERTKYNQKCS
jgi:flagellar basal body-associated protein FliL